MQQPNVDSIKIEEEIRNNNNNTLNNLIKQYRMKMNKKFLSLSSSSPITDSNISHTFS